MRCADATVWVLCGVVAWRGVQYTDDTSMALCLAESLLIRGGHDPSDQMQRYVQWYRSGRFSSNGEWCVACPPPAPSPRPRPFAWCCAPLWLW